MMLETIAPLGDDPTVIPPVAAACQIRRCPRTLCQPGQLHHSVVHDVVDLPDWSKNSYAAVSRLINEWDANPAPLGAKDWVGE